VPEPGLEAAGKLGSWLEAHGLDEQVHVRGRATVGLSQETWFLDAVGAAGTREIVLRLPTPASGAAAILAQCAALQAVAAHGVLAPELVWSDAGTENPFGRPFLVMERRPGRAPVGWHALDEALRTRLAQEAVDLLARLHAIDVSETPLAGIQPAPTLRLPGLTKLFTRLEPVPPIVTVALRWLARHEPATVVPPVMVHGDFRMGNLLADRDRISGVLDWEMAAPGDRLLDLSWCFIPVFELPGVEEAPLVQRYGERAGIEIDPVAWHWYRVFGYLRLAFYHLAGARAFDRGRSDDLRLAALRLALPVTLDRLSAALVGVSVT
jgi:aminoglycoside phosphotransferase (APT) family kinase protein